MKFLISTILFIFSITANAQVWQANTAKLGDGANTSKQFVFNKGTLSSNPRIQYNSSTGVVEFSNDNTTFYALPVAIANQWVPTNAAPTCTVAANALTCAMKQNDASTDPTSPLPAKFPVRGSTVTTGNYNIRSVTAAQSVVISSSTKLGLAANTSTPYYLYEIDTNGSGTMALGLSGQYYDDGSTVDVMDESQSITCTSASPCVCTWTGHNFVNGDSMTMSGTVPTGFPAAGTALYVVNKATNTVQLSLTPGGAAINSSSTGTSVVGRIHNGRMVTTASIYTGVAVHGPIGMINISEVTPGTWASAPTNVIPNPGPQSLRQRQFFNATPSSAISIGNSVTVLSEFTTVFQCRGIPVMINTSGSYSIGNGSNLTGFMGVYVDAALQASCQLNNMAPNCGVAPCYLTWAIPGCYYSCPAGAHTIDIRAQGNATANFIGDSGTHRNFTIQEMW